MKTAREFWITRDLVTKGNKIVDCYDVFTERTAQMASDEYHHGTEIIHVIESGGIEQQANIFKNLLDYCEPHLDQMWAAKIVSLILGGDFKDAKDNLAIARGLK